MYVFYDVYILYVLPTWLQPCPKTDFTDSDCFFGFILRSGLCTLDFKNYFDAV